MLALDEVTLDIPAGCMVGLIGPDGVGKSSLLSLIAGARADPGGRGRRARRRHGATPRIAPTSARASPTCRRAWARTSMPTSACARTSSSSAACSAKRRGERDRKIAELLASTGLAPFADRPAKKLSGGMRQKLGLCCCLIHDPDLLILDEPTTGVDPLSRRQFWELIDRMRARRPGMSVVVATAYMEEAERFDWLAAMNAGKVLASGSPTAIKANGADTLEEAFIALLPEERARRPSQARHIPPRRLVDGEPVIVARDLTCRFGDFTAVDRVSFTIERGEIFGFLGSNGCGKTTTMKMLTGLLPPSEGEALLFGKPLDAGDMSARYRVGYMSQSFSLYTELTVRQNLELHAHLFHLPAAKAKARIAELVARFRPRGLSRPAHARPAARHPPAPVAGGRDRARAGNPDPRRADLGRRPAGARPVLGAADRPVAQSGRDDLRLHPFHERGRALRPHLADGFGPRARDRHAGGAGRGARRRDARGRLHRLSRGGDRARGASAPGRAPRRIADGRAARRGRARPGSACAGCWPIRSARPSNCCAIRSGSASACSAPRC